MTVIWPVNQIIKVTVVGVIVQVIAKALVCVRMCAEGCVVVECTSFSVCAVSLVLISAEGFKAGNTLSWLGTSDILFTSLPL